MKLTCSSTSIIRKYNLEANLISLHAKVSEFRRRAPCPPQEPLHTHPNLNQTPHTADLHCQQHLWHWHWRAWKVGLLDLYFSRLVVPPLWSWLKHLNNYWRNCSEKIHGPQRINPIAWWSFDFSSSDVIWWLWVKCLDNYWMACHLVCTFMTLQLMLTTDCIISDIDLHTCLSFHSDSCY